MPVQQRMWDTNIVLDYLSGNQRVQPDCDLIINEGGQGQLEIVVSTITETEVAHLSGLSATDSEAKIREFFSREYVVIATLDSPIARIARKLIRSYGLSGADAAHLATAIRWHIPILETRDDKLLRISRQEGNPLIVIQHPRYEGTMPMFPPSAPQPT